MKPYTQSQDFHAYWIPSGHQSMLDDIDCAINHVIEQFQIPAYIIMSQYTYAGFCTTMSRKNKQHFIQHYDKYYSERLTCELDIVQTHDSRCHLLSVVPKASQLNNGCFLRINSYVDHNGAEKNHAQQMKDYESAQADKILLGEEDGN